MGDTSFFDGIGLYPFQHDRLIVHEVEHVAVLGGDPLGLDDPAVIEGDEK